QGNQSGDQNEHRDHGLDQTEPVLVMVIHRACPPSLDLLRGEPWRRAHTHTLFRDPQAAVEFPQLDPADLRYGHGVTCGAVAQVDDVGAGRHSPIVNWNAAAVEYDEFG